MKNRQYLIILWIYYILIVHVNWYCLISSYPVILIIVQNSVYMLSLTNWISCRHLNFPTSNYIKHNIMDLRVWVNQCIWYVRARTCTYMRVYVRSPHCTITLCCLLWQLCRINHSFAWNHWFWKGREWHGRGISGMFHTYIHLCATMRIHLYMLPNINIIWIKK